MVSTSGPLLLAFRIRIALISRLVCPLFGKGQINFEQHNLEIRLMM
mgnify:CR=1 FL=1